MKLILLISILASTLAVGAGAEESDSLASPTVGMPVMIEQFVIPGPKVQAKPIEDKKSPVVVRVVDVFPHGDALRYDLEFYGLDPGTYDLRKFLQREDGSDLSDAPPMKVTVSAILAPEEVLPNDRIPDRVGRFGGYKIGLAVIATLWILGLWALVTVGRKRGREEGETAERKLTFADRLRPLVKRAQAGELDESEMAQLERLVLGFWRDRLNLGDEDASTAVPKLRTHEEAGRLLRTIERWLHDPRGRDEKVDVAALLEPYAREAAR